jgi:hypothetical protein
LIERRVSCYRGDGGLAPGVNLGRSPDRDPITLVVEAMDWEGMLSGWYFKNEQRERIALEASVDDNGNPILLDETSSSVTLQLQT